MFHADICGILGNFYSIKCFPNGNVFACLVKLALEAGVGIAVFVRCFVNKQSMKVEIVDTLGNGFSRAPFATVVVCTQ